MGGSTAAYNLLAYTCASKVNQILTAPQLLVKRSTAIQQLKAAMGDPCPQMTVAELMATHIVYTAFTFKPYAALAFAYSTYSPTGGGCDFDSDMDLRIKNDGDFFSDCAGLFTLPAATTDEQPLPDLTVGVVPGNSNVSDIIFNFIHDAPDVAVATNVAGTFYEYVDGNGIVIADAAGTATAAATSLGYTVSGGIVQAANWLRLVEYPGLRLIREAEFSIQQNEIDKYEDFVSVFYAKVTLSDTRRRAFNNLVGQENHRASGSLASLGAAHSSGKLGAPVAAAATGYVAEDRCKHSHQLHMSAGIGHQTPKPSIAETELLVPFLFEFSRNKDSAIPAMAVPDNDREISVRVAAADEIYQLAPGPLRIRESITYTAPAYTVVREHPFIIPGGTITLSGKLRTQLLVNNIYVDEIVHDIFMYRVGFIMVRIFKRHRETLSSSSNTVRLTGLKFAVEYFFVMSRPRDNTTLPKTSTAATLGYLNNWRLWHRGAWYDERKSWQSQAFGTAGVVATNGNATSFAQTAKIEQEAQDWLQCHPTIKKFEVSIQGSSIYMELSNLFYNSYVPFIYGWNRIYSSEDCDVLMVTFGLHPGLKNPNGHYSASRARETDVTYTAGVDCDGVDTVSATREAIMLVCAIVINFLLLSDCGASLHFT